MCIFLGNHTKTVDGVAQYSSAGFVATDILVTVWPY